MQRIQQGDREAFATLYARYNQTVYRIALEATGSQQDALEIVKAVFKEMYQTIVANGPYLGDLYGWLDALTAKQIRMRRFQQQPQAAAGSMLPPRQYSEPQAEAIETRAGERLQDEPLFEPDHRKRKRGVSMVILGVAAAMLVWVLIGLLGSLKVLPQWDLGYQWFNETLFPLF